MEFSESTVFHVTLFSWAVQSFANDEMSPLVYLLQRRARLPRLRRLIRHSRSSTNPFM